MFCSAPFKSVWGVLALARLNRHQKKRSWVQGLAFLAGNANLSGFITGRIYQGPLKHLCLPGLNCYSCPGALGACPIGSLQNGLADPFWRIPLYVIGFLMLLGALAGRFVCGWLCPFGWFQELLHKIPTRKIRPEKKPKLNRVISRGNIFFLILFVILIPIIVRLINGYGITAFCTYICPSGTLMAGWPLILTNRDLRDLIGLLFGWKTAVLIAVLVLSILIYRPFCRYICPLGAIYGFFNRVSLYRVTVDTNRCVECGLCTRQCKMSVPVPYDGNTPACIRCGECEAVCPHDAITCGFPKRVRAATDSEPKSS